MKSNKKISGKKILLRYVLITLIITVGVISSLSVFYLKKYKQSENLKVSRMIAGNFAEKITFKFEKAILTSQLIAQIINNNNNISENLKNTLINILKSNKETEELFLFLGDISLLKNKKDIFLQDSSENYNFLSLIKTKNNIRYSNFVTNEIIINQPDLNKLLNSKSTLITEPFKINNGKKTENVIGFISPVRKKTKLTGFVAVCYKTKTFTSFISENKQTKCNFILLSPQKNIISQSGNIRNTGKNILNIHGKESELYNKSHLKNESFSGSVLKINPAGSESAFEFISSYNNPVNKGHTDLLIIFIISFIILFAGILFILYITNKIFEPFKKILSSVEKLSKGENIEESINSFQYEYKDAAENLNKISKYQDETAAFAEQIISENFDIALKERSKYDKSSKSLNKISKYLKDKKQKQTAKEKETSLQLWMRKGRFEISEAERYSSKDIEDLSFNIIRSIVNYIDALMGGIYLYDKNNEEISLVAAYAYDKQKHFNANFKPGEGIVGACVLEKKKVILSSIPEDYIKIATGLGSGRPSFIAVIPIFFKNEINAVIEVAFMNKPEDYKIEFIEQLSDSIGSWIDASLISTKTGELLSISQKQTQELAEKENELNKKVIELQEIQEKTAEINTRYESMLNAVNQTIMTVEYSLDGTINNCNSVYTKIMGFEPEDIKGKNVLEIVKDQSEELKETIEKVKKGNSVKKQVKRYTKNGEEKQLTATYTPYYDKDGKISQILFFAFDITNISNT